MGLFRRHLRIYLALQGGGALGAFSWGVLDRLLEEENLEIGWMSGASAGAVNAVALAAGFAEDGREGARRRMRIVWEAVHRAGVPDLLRLNPFLYGLTQSSSMAQVASFWSPYDLNPLGFDPLRQLLTETIDFDKVRSQTAIELLIAATDVATGRARLFRRAELGIEALLASSCLPTLHCAVEIEGRAYWDGGFSANPDLVTLAIESPVRDTLIVQLNPSVRPSVPTTARDIAGQVNRLTFNAALLRDAEIIESARRTLRGPFGVRRDRMAPLVKHRFHLIEAGRYTGALSPETKMKPDWGLLTYLHGAGRTEAHKWLDANRRNIGRRETVDLTERYLNGHRQRGPAVQPVAANGAGEDLHPAAPAEAGRALGT